MKTIHLFYISLISLMAFVSMPNQAWASGGTEEVTIQTNAICGSCQERIESALYKVPGVKSAELDLEYKTVTVKFKTSKTSVEELRQVIAGVGYDADDVKADSSARKDLPHCCVHGH